MPEAMTWNRMETNIGEFRRREQCRVCGSKNLSTFLDYGNMPLAGGFLLREQLGAGKLYPMDLAFCLDCSLVQILNVVPADILFTDYRYLSSVTQALSQHFRDYAVLLKEEILPDDHPFVVEIGCNDGVLLGPLRDLGVKTVGVDAAENVIAITRQRGHEVIPGFFGVAIAEKIVAEHGKPDVITASNVFAHIDELDEVMRGVERLLAPYGTFIVEVHYIVDLLKTFQFDTVYHEHLCYYSLHALQTLYKRFGFIITNVHHLSMHGGAIRVFAQRDDSVPIHIDPVLYQMMEQERVFGINRMETYARFGQQVEQYRDRLQLFLVDRKRGGRSLSAYGAAGRATTLLNYCQLDHSVVNYIVDDSPFRCGRYVPGVLIPIVSPSTLHEKPTNDCLITAWNYREEIVAKEPDYLDQGGCFIMPLPKIELIGG